MTWDRGVEGGALLALRWMTRRSRAAFGYQSGSPEPLWPLNTFYCGVKVSAMNDVDWRLTYVVISEQTVRTQLNATSSRRNCALSDLEMVYSPGRRKKHHLTIIMSHSAWITGSSNAVSIIKM